MRAGAKAEDERHHLTAAPQASGKPVHEIERALVEKRCASHAKVPGTGLRREQQIDGDDTGIDHLSAPFAMRVKNPRRVT